MISETKIDYSFPSAQFHLELYATRYRLDRYANIGDILFHIKEYTPSKLVVHDLSVEWFFAKKKEKRNGFVALVILRRT